MGPASELLRRRMELNKRLLCKSAFSLKVKRDSASLSRWLWLWWEVRDLTPSKERKKGMNFCSNKLAHVFICFYFQWTSTYDWSAYWVAVQTHCCSDFLCCCTCEESFTYLYIAAETNTHKHKGRKCLIAHKT